MYLCLWNPWGQLLVGGHALPSTKIPKSWVLFSGILSTRLKQGDPCLTMDLDALLTIYKVQTFSWCGSLQIVQLQLVTTCFLMATITLGHIRDWSGRLGEII